MGDGRSPLDHRGVTRRVTDSGDAFYSRGSGDGESRSSGQPHGTGAINRKAHRSVRAIPGRVEPEIERRTIGAISGSVHHADNRPPVNIDISRRDIVINAIDGFITANLKVVLSVALFFDFYGGDILNVIFP